MSAWKARGDLPLRWKPADVVSVALGPEEYLTATVSLRLGDREQFNARVVVHLSTIQTRDDFKALLCDLVDAPDTNGPGSRI